LIQASKAAYEKFDKYYNIQSDYAIAAVVLDPRLNVSYYLDENNPATLEQAESAKREVLHYFDINYKSEEFCNVIYRNSQPLEDIDRIYKKPKLVSLGGTCEVRQCCLSGNKLLRLVSY
jgi:hypothetical protein